MLSSDTDNGGNLAAPATDPAMTVQKGRAIGENVLNVEETSGVPTWLSTKKKKDPRDEKSSTGGVLAASRNMIVDLTSPEPSSRSPAAQLSAKKKAKMTPTGLTAMMLKNGGERSPSNGDEKPQSSRRNSRTAAKSSKKSLISRDASTSAEGYAPKAKYRSKAEEHSTLAQQPSLVKSQNGHNVPGDHTTAKEGHLSSLVKQEGKGDELPTYDADSLKVDSPKRSHGTTLRAGDEQETPIAIKRDPVPSSVISSPGIADEKETSLAKNSDPVPSSVTSKNSDPVPSSMISSPGIVDEKETSLAKKRKHSTHGAEKEKDGESRQIGEKLPRTAEEGQKAIDCENDRGSLSKRPRRRAAAQRQSSYAEPSISVDDQPAPEGEKEAAEKGPETMNGQDSLSKRPRRRNAAQQQSSYAEPSISVDDQPAPEGEKEAAEKGPETLNDRDSLRKRPRRRAAAQRQASYAESSIAVDDQPASEGEKEAAEKGPETLNGQDTSSKRTRRRIAAQRQASYAEPSITADDEPAPGDESGTVGKTEPAPFHVKKDPNKYYIEEEAHLYHNPPLPSDSTVGVLPCDLAPLPPPPPPPSPMPRTGNCNWAYDEANRVFTADFRNHGGPIDPIDEDFMLKVMERDDLTLISDGLLDPRGLKPHLWTMKNIAGTYGDDFFHKFRRFDTVFDEKGGAIVLEKDSLYSMRMIDYGLYLQKREEVPDGVENDSKFCFKDHLGKDHEIDVQKSALYCIDLDMKKSVKEIYDDFLRNFRMASILPGGEHCLMNKVTEDARPFMGPNLYITPPGTFTHFHQDGHGTVDSGHLALSGYNEICILRRLTERHKRHALWLLTGTKTEEKSARQTFFDGLYAEPHADGHGEKPAWPTTAQIEECRKMGYCPSLPILKKGQHIHINKGRLHAFRKMTLGNAHEDDCHHEARMKVFATEKLVSEQLCVSVAWDWNFLGSTERGIYRELSSTLEAAILNRLRSVRSLAIPEFALLEAARHFAKPTLPKLNVQLVPTAEKTPCQEDQYETTVCRGILPVLRYVIKEHVAAIEAAGANATGEAENNPDTYADPSLSAIDPRGSDGFSCKTCSMELSNVYFHCDGCEKLLSKDFNICLACHSGKKYKIFSQMHPNQQRRHATLNHVGNMQLERSKRCPCKNGPVCKDCGFCLGCSCKCHTRFTLHCRLHTKETELKILGRVEAKADLALSRNPCEYLDDAALTEQRFAMAKRSWGHIDDINPYC